MTISNNSTGLRSGVCLSTSRPTSPYTGQTIFETDTNKMLVWNGTAWVIPNQTTQNPEGLELIRTTTCSSGGTASNGIVTVNSTVSSIVLDNAFSSSYSNYRIIYSGGSGATSLYLTLQMGSTTTGYFGSLFGAAYSGGGFIGIGVNNAANWPHAGLASTNYTVLDVDLYHPNLVKTTNMKSNWTFNLTSTGYSTFMGEQASTTSYTGFTIGTSSSTVSGGTIVVYGYRNS